MNHQPRGKVDLAMDRYATGENTAFGDVYDGVAPRLYAYLRRQTRSEVIAEDLVQATLLQMHRARGSFISGSPVLPWAFAIARRLLIDYLRKNKRDALAFAVDAVEGRIDNAEADLLFEAKQVAGLIARELTRLPHSQRVAFELIRFDGLSQEDAAAVLGTTVSAVKLRAHRAYSALRTAIGDLGDS